MNAMKPTVIKRESNNNNWIPNGTTRDDDKRASSRADNDNTYSLRNE